MQAGVELLHSRFGGHENIPHRLASLLFLASPPAIQVQQELPVYPPCSLLSSLSFLHKKRHAKNALIPEATKKNRALFSS
jgi:hypothetical protein